MVLLLPKPSVHARPALDGDPAELDRLAELEEALYNEPTSVERAVTVADAYLDFYRPDWALAVLARFGEAADYRVHLVRATARAERLEPAKTVAEAKLGRQACDRVRCPESAQIKLDLIASTMQALVDSGIDPRKQPVQAREAVSRALHAVKNSRQPAGNSQQ